MAADAAGVLWSTVVAVALWRAGCVDVDGKEKGGSWRGEGLLCLRCGRCRSGNAKEVAGLVMAPYCAQLMVGISPWLGKGDRDV